MKRFFKISVLLITIAVIFGCMFVYAYDCGHVLAYTTYSNNEKWAKGVTERYDTKQVSAYVYGTYRLANDYTSYSFSAPYRATGYGNVSSSWSYGYILSYIFVIKL